MDFKKIIEEGMLDLDLSLLPSKIREQRSSETCGKPGIVPGKSDAREKRKVAKTEKQSDGKEHQQSEILDSIVDGYLDINLDAKRTHVNKEARKFSDVEKILEKSSIVPGFEKLNAVPPLEVSKMQLRRARQKEREKSKGPQWFNMQAPELTNELKRDLEVLQMRSALDPKHFYKKNDLKVLPKFFQVGHVEDDPADFYSSRIPRKQRKKTLVDELMADADFKNYNKRRYKEIIEERRKSTSYKAYRHAKRLKQKGKSRK